MEKDPSNRFTTTQEDQFPQHEKSGKLKYTLGLLIPVLGGTGATAFITGILKFNPPNPPLIIGGSIVVAACVISSLSIQRTEEEARKKDTNVIFSDTGK